MALSSDDMFLALIVAIRQYGTEGHLKIDNVKGTHEHIMSNEGKARLVAIPVTGEDSILLCAVIGEESIKEWEAFGLLNQSPTARA